MIDLASQPAPAEAPNPEVGSDHIRHNALWAAAETVSDGTWTEGARLLDRRRCVPTDSYEYHDPATKYTGELGEEATIDAVYGNRYTGEGNDIKVEKCDLGILTRINETIAQTVLTEEHSHIPRVVMPPEPEQHTDSPKNNDFWLDQIGNHDTWPIMQFRKKKVDPTGFHADPNGELEIFSHDTDDKHLGNLMLFPQEMQDQISEAARHTLAFRQTEKGKDKPDITVPGDAVDEEKDPLAYNERGGPTSTKYRGGIKVIDDITDNKTYMSLLSSLVNMSDEEIETVMSEFSAIAEGLKTGEMRYNDPNLSAEDSRKISVVADLYDQRHMIGDVANFNTRHREGRRITEQELQIVQDQYVQGILRVASKIRSNSTTAFQADTAVNNN